MNTAMEQLNVYWMPMQAMHNRYFEALICSQYWQKLLHHYFISLLFFKSEAFWIRIEIYDSRLIYIKYPFISAIVF